MYKGTKLAGLMLVGVVGLTACNPGSGVSASNTYTTNGPAGQIVDREYEDGHYELETKSNGKNKEFNVTLSVYNDCFLYQYYPSCVKKSTTKDNKHKAYKTPKPKKSKKAKKSKGFSWGTGKGKSKSKSKH